MYLKFIVELFFTSTSLVAYFFNQTDFNFVVFLHIDEQGAVKLHG